MIEPDSVKQENGLKPVMQVRFKHAFMSTFAITVIALMLFYFYDQTWNAKPVSYLESTIYGVLFAIILYFFIFQLTVKWSPIARHTRHLIFQLRNLYQPFTWPQIIIASAFAGFGEELLLRGIVQDFITQHTAAWLGILLASVIFGLLHFLNWTYVLVTFAMGVVFGVVFHVTQNMMLVMIAHGVYDVFAFAVIMKYPNVLGNESSRQY